jgi:hypothetical protein
MKFIVQITTQNFDSAGVDKAELEGAIQAAMGKVTDLVDRRLQERAKVIDGIRLQAQRVASVLKAALANDEVLVSVDVTKNEPISVSPAPARTSRPAAPRAAVTPAEGLNNPQQRILDALASFEALGLDQVSKSNVAVFSAQSPRSSGYRNNLSVLSAGGYIERVGGDALRLTDAGRSVASGEAPASLEELHDAWAEKLTGPQRLMLRLLTRAYPEGVDRDELAKSSGQSPLSSGYRNNLSVLSSLGLLVRANGDIVATRLLFPEGSARRRRSVPRDRPGEAGAGAASAPHDDEGGLGPRRTGRSTRRARA